MTERYPITGGARIVPNICSSNKAVPAPRDLKKGGMLFKANVVIGDTFVNTVISNSTRNSIQTFLELEFITISNDIVENIANAAGIKKYALRIRSLKY